MGLAEYHLYVTLFFLSNYSIFLFLKSKTCFGTNLSMCSQLTTMQPKPFVKWAGGKRQLLPILGNNLPASFGRYFEPFLGGGAMLFHILTVHSNHACSVSDINHELILAYTTIRDRVDELICSLNIHKKNYFENPESYYYKVRDGYQADEADDIQKAARLIFLNRTCFNGLYRVNSKGKFNVPLGRYVNPNITDEENLRIVSQILQSPRLSISCRDFEGVVDDAREGDLVYFDPPYVPVSKTSSFTSYTHSAFTLDDQRNLARICANLDSIGCKVLLSNSDSEIVAEMFESAPWKVERIKATRRINSVSHKRSGQTEFLIRNY